MTKNIDYAACLEQDRLVAEQVLAFLQPLSPIATALDNVRKAADSGAELPTVWPLDSVFVATDALVSIYTQLKKMMAQQQGQSFNDPNDSQEMLDQYIVEPSIMSVLVPWEKTRTVVHITKDELDDSLLETNAKILTTLPQWSTFFDISDRNFLWDGEKIRAVAFARYFFGMNKALPVEETQVSVSSEPQSFINNMICVFVNEQGKFLLGPFLPIHENYNIAELANKASVDILENIKSEAENGDMPPEKFEQLKNEAQDTCERTKNLFKILVYFLQNVGGLKDKDGNAQNLPANPKTVNTNVGPQLVSAQELTSLFLD